MEEHFKNNLKKVKVEWDKEQLWEELEPKLPNKKRKRFFWQGLILFAILGMATYIGFQKITLEEEVETTLTSNEKIESTNAELSFQNNLNTDLKTVEKNENFIESKNQQITKQIPTPNINTQATQSENNKVAKSIFKKDVKTSPEVKTKNNILNDIPSPNGLGSTLVDFQKENKNFKINSPTSKSNTSKTQSTDVIKNITEKENIKRKTTISILEIESLKPFQLIRLDSSFEITKDLFSPENEGRIRNGFFIDLSTTTGLINRTSTFTAATEEERTFLKDNKSKENPYINLGFNFGLGYQHHSGIFLKSGLEYHHIREFFQFDGLINSDTILQNYEKAFFRIDTNGDTIFTAGIAEIQNNEYREVKHWNKINYYSIPLQIGYLHQMGRSSIMTSLGINFSFAEKLTGKQVDKFGGIVSDQKLLLNKKIGFKIGVGGRYRFNQKTYIFGMASFQQSPSFSQGDVGFKYQSYNMEIGIRAFIF